MTTVIIISSIFFALFFLCLLTIIDLKIRLLPNKYVAGFLFTGLVFHFVTKFEFVELGSLIAGAFSGAGLLYLIRAVANKYYKQDTLGLGDVKLMGAAGAWLGIEYIFLALSIGAFAGLIHGVLYAFYVHKKTGERLQLSKLKIPAGPGFIAGILITALFAFESLPHFLLDF